MPESGRTYPTLALAQDPILNDRPTFRGLDAGNLEARIAARAARFQRPVGDDEFWARLNIMVPRRAA